MSGEPIIDDPYSEQSPPPQQSETKPWDEIMVMAIEAKLRETHVALPARIVKVRNNGFVDIELCIMRKFNTGDIVKLPVVQDVPVKHPSGQDWWVKLPIAEGDYGTALVHERSLDVFKVSGGIVDPKDPRMHEFSDSEFLPGFSIKDSPLEGPAEEMILHNGSAEIVIQKAGRFKIMNESQELIDLIEQTLDAIEDLRGRVGSTVSTVSSGPIGIISSPVPASPVPTSPVVIAALVPVTAGLTALATQLATLKTNLLTLKGT